MVTDEASAAVLGFVHKEATGEHAAPARVAGTVDLSRGSDLSVAAYLRIGVDAGGFHDVRCAGPRPRATLDSDVVAAVDQVYPGLATSTAGRLVLTSPSAGAGSQIRFDAPRPGLDLLGLTPGESSGTDASQVRVAGTVDLSGGVDLPAGAILSLAVDGATAVEVRLAPAGPARLSLDDVVIAVNGQLAASVATRDATRLILLSRLAGSASRIELATPSGVDATEALLGFAAPRVYQGTDATRARVSGTADLSGARDVRWARRLQLAVDSRPPQDVNLAASAADPAVARLADIVAAVNAAAPGVAAADGGHLTLTSPTTGSASRIALAPSPADDAREVVLGQRPTSVTGTAATPAGLTGDVDLTGTVDLSRRSLLRLQIGDTVTAIDVAGPVAAATSLDQVLAAVNAALPGTASATADARLRLVAPPDAERIAVLPLRHLELEEYGRSAPSAAGPVTVRHGHTWRLVSDSVIPEPLRLRLRPERGAAGPAVAGPGWEVRVLRVVPPGAELTLTADDETGAITATIGTPGQPAEPLAHDDVLLRPLAGHEGEDPPDALRLPAGRSTWRYLECAAARFDYARFDHDRFAGAPLRERAVFDVTRFGDQAGSPLRPEFDTANPVPDLPVAVTSEWLPHRAGTLTVNLPLDLDPRFGSRFNEARFGHPDGGAEAFPSAVTEPTGDERYLVTLINAGFPGGAHAAPVPASALASATLVARTPLGFTAQPMPFRIPARFSGGGPGAPARAYLAEEGFGGQVLELAAKQPGAFGNDLEVAARPAGPGRFDVTVALRAARFESARNAVLGRPPAARVADLLTPGPVGVLIARAAGVAAHATREDTGTPV
jgi:hypothetical protein